MSECKYGLTAKEIVGIIDDVIGFMQWMRYQSVDACTGKVYDHIVKNYVPDDCGPHGIIYAINDVKSYLENSPQSPDVLRNFET